MTKFFVVVFGLLTAVAVYLTTMDVEVYNPSIDKSVRAGSAGHARHHGGYARGK